MHTDTLIFAIMLGVCLPLLAFVYFQLFRIHTGYHLKQGD